MPITWSSKYQEIVSISTTEAEYKSLTNGAKEAVYLQRLLLEIQAIQQQPTTLSSSDN